MQVVVPVPRFIILPAVNPNSSPANNNANSATDADSSSNCDDESCRKKLEKECDLEWDRNLAMCKADAAMRGYDANRYRQCIREIDDIYIKCIKNADRKCR